MKIAQFINSTSQWKSILAVCKMALESSPEVLNNLLSRIGAPEKYKVDMILLCCIISHLSQIHDVLGTEEEDLQELPGKLRSVLLLLPKDEMYREKLQEKNSDVGVSSS